MTMSGSKVEDLLITGAEIENVVVGKVLSLTRHPDSDHLWVCRMDVGRAAPQPVVTGAQNLREGDYVPVAQDGATLSGGVIIRAGVLRGVESRGMLCSLKELGLDAHDFPQAVEDGIFVLRSEEDKNPELACDVGQDIREVLGMGDSVVEFEITNNRPDCLSVRGLLARAPPSLTRRSVCPKRTLRGRVKISPISSRWRSKTPCSVRAIRRGW
jgi:phenylalanyl-tRNA synthetase beta chain